MSLARPLKHLKYACEWPECLALNIDSMSEYKFKKGAHGSIVG
jgi:hypothetical protein